MYKKVLCLSVLVLGLCQLTLADDLGSNDLSSGVNTSTDYNPGIYFGGQFGAANLHYSSKYTGSRNSYDDKYKFAARGYAGYSFNPFISLELGYDYYGYPKFKDDQTGNTQNFLQQGVDLMAKANLPLDYGFGVYVKGGLAWVFRGALNSNAGTFGAGKDANNTFTPVGALGVNYWFAPNIALDLCWTKTMTVSDLPTIDLFTAGFIYKINL